MSEFSSYDSQYLDKKLTKIEQEILKLKAIQNYNPSQINYSYKSNTVSVASYVIFPSYFDQHQGILATFLFKSHFPTVFPRVSFDYTGYGQAAGYIGQGALMTIRTEYVNKNTTRIMIYMIDTIIPMDSPYHFDIQAFVYSNVAGTLELEQTYVLP